MFAELHLTLRGGGEGGRKSLMFETTNNQKLSIPSATLLISTTTTHLPMLINDWHLTCEAVAIGVPTHKIPS